MNFTFSFTFHWSYYKTHSDADWLWPTLKQLNASSLHNTSLVLFHYYQWSCQRQRPVASRRSPDVREYFLVQSCVYTNQSQLRMKSDGGVTSGKYTSTDKRTHLSNWGTEKRSTIACIIHSSVLTLRKHDTNRWTAFMQWNPEVLFWPETTAKQQFEKWISQKRKGKSKCITSAQCIKLNVLF